MLSGKQREMHMNEKPAIAGPGRAIWMDGDKTPTLEDFNDGEHWEYIEDLKHWPYNPKSDKKLWIKCGDGIHRLYDVVDWGKS
jgi:hypothetical protein